MRWVTAPATTWSTRRDVSGTSRPATKAQPEVVASRLLWAVGYHQPIVYYVPEWKLKNGPVPKPFGGPVPLELQSRRHRRMVVDRQPVQGHARTEGLDPREPADQQLGPEAKQQPDCHGRGPKAAGRWFIAQDIGASFGKTGWPVGNRNSVEDYERQNFVVGVENGRVQFDYQARHRDLLEDITPADVVWISQLFARITDRQLADAFRAAGMPDEIGQRYIRKLKSKIQEGLSLRSTTVVRR